MPREVELQKAIPSVVLKFEPSSKAAYGQDLHTRSGVSTGYIVVSVKRYCSEIRKRISKGNSLASKGP
jgi:hypothetical protein